MTLFPVAIFLINTGCNNRVMIRDLLLNIPRNFTYFIVVMDLWRRDFLKLLGHDNQLETLPTLCWLACPISYLVGGSSCCRRSTKLVPAATIK